jgi:hypothetical protein
MASTVFRPSVRFALVAIMLCTMTATQAQPKLDMHRVGVSADDGSGWHLAVSSKGSFSVRLPIPFNDFTTHDPTTGEVSYVVGGKSSEGIKFSVVEVPAGGRKQTDFAEIPKSLASNPATKVSDVSRSASNGADTLSLTTTNAATTAHARYIQMKGTLYILTVEYPNAYRELVAANKDKFFGSFKLKAKS